MLRLDEPTQGVAVVGVFSMGDDARAVASIFFYGDAADAAAAEQENWTRWLAGLLQPVPGRV